MAVDARQGREGRVLGDGVHRDERIVDREPAGREVSVQPHEPPAQDPREATDDEERSRARSLPRSARPQSTARTHCEVTKSVPWPARSASKKRSTASVRWCTTSSASRSKPTRSRTISGASCARRRASSDAAGAESAPSSPALRARLDSPTTLARGGSRTIGIGAWREWLGTTRLGFAAPTPRPAARICRRSRGSPASAPPFRTQSARSRGASSRFGDGGGRKDRAPRSSRVVPAPDEPRSYGTKKARLGRDSMLPFGYCCLSLQPVVDPVVTCVTGVAGASRVVCRRRRAAPNRLLLPSPPRAAVHRATCTRAR